MRKLESEFDRQLNTARASAPDVRIADADVAGGANVVGAAAHFPPTAVHLKIAGSRPTAIVAGLARNCPSSICDIGRQEGIGEVGVIKDVEEIDAELHVDPFRNRRVLIHGEVPFLKGRTMQRVAAFVAVVAGAGDAVLGGTAGRGLGSGRNLAREGKRA